MTLAGSLRSRSDVWFAWYPVRLGALGVGRLVWWEYVWRNRCMRATIYQSLEVAADAPEVHAHLVRAGLVR